MRVIFFILLSLCVEGNAAEVIPLNFQCFLLSRTSTVNDVEFTQPLFGIYANEKDQTLAVIQKNGESMEDYANALTASRSVLNKTIVYSLVNGSVKITLTLSLKDFNFKITGERKTGYRGEFQQTLTTDSIACFPL